MEKNRYDGDSRGISFHLHWKFFYFLDGELFLKQL